MSKKIFQKVGTVALVAVMAAPFAANAESTFATGAGAQSTQARVDFTITIPRFVSLRVGATAAAISSVTFAPTAAQMEAGGSVTGAGGDLGGGVVTAIVRGNGGAVTLGASTLGALQSGANTINWSEITTTTSVPALTPPTLVNGASTSTTVTAAANGVVNQSAAWTYTYANSAVVPAGTYGGINANNGRVTYTASVL
jgi:hypothetical protein